MRPTGSRERNPELGLSIPHLLTINICQFWPLNMFLLNLLLSIPTALPLPNAVIVSTASQLLSMLPVSLPSSHGQNLQDHVIFLFPNECHRVYPQEVLLTKLRFDKWTNTSNVIYFPFLYMKVAGCYSHPRAQSPGEEGRKGAGTHRRISLHKNKPEVASTSPPLPPPPRHCHNSKFYPI